MTLSNSAKSSWNSPFFIGLDLPALLTMTCRPPNVSTAAVDESTDLRLVADVGVVEAARRDPGPSANAVPSSSWTSAITTLAPSATNRSTMPRPMPDAPPVTIATLPASSCS